MGGPVESVRQLGTYFTARGHRFEVAAAADTPRDEWVARFPLPVHPLGPAYTKYAYSPRVRPWLEAHAAQYDVLIINGVWQAHTRIAARHARAHGIPHFIYTHGLLDPWNRSAHPVKYLKKLGYWWLFEKTSLEGADGVVFTSAEEASLASRYLPSARWRPVVVGGGIEAPPPVPSPDAEALLARFPVARGRRVWLFLSRVHPKKGLENLLAVMPSMAWKHETPLLMIAGDGDERYVEQLRKAALPLGADVLFTGPLYDRDKWAAYSLAELFVLPTHQENFGIVLAEALATGTPVITTRAANTWREIEAANAGIVCEDSVRSLRAALERWEAMDPAGRERMGQAARDCFRSHFEVGIAARRLMAALERSVAARSAAAAG